MSKSRIGNDPLDALLSVERDTTTQQEQPEATPPIEATKALKPKKPKKVRVTVLLDEGLADKARDCVYWSPGQTLASLAEEALEREIKRRAKKRGEEFPKRSAEIPLGRPIQ